MANVSGRPAPAILERRMDAGDDTALVARARSGDLAAFECLYRRHAGRVHALCRRLCRDTARAEDLTQEAFIKAWRALPRFRGEAAFSSWLHRIAVNVTLGELRKGALHTVPLNPEAMEAAVPQAPRERQDLEQALAALPPGARTAFVLHAVEGYSHEEIAGMTGIAVGTSKAQVHRARQLLMEYLDA